MYLERSSTCVISSYTDTTSPDVGVIGALRADGITVTSGRREATVERVLVLSVLMLGADG